MKRSTLIPLVIAFGLAAALPAAAPAQQARGGAPAGQDDEEMQKAQPGRIELPASFRTIIYRDKEGRTEQLRGVFIFKVENGRYVIADNAQGARFTFLEPATIKNIALETPEEIQLALDTWIKGNHAAALPMLERLVTRYKDLRDLPGAHIRRLEILHLDSLRRTGNFDKLRDALAIIKPEDYSPWGQDMIYALKAWEAHSKRDWRRLEILTRDLDKVAPGEPAAQLAFTRAVALHRLDRPDEALAEYHRAMTIDYTRSRELMAESLLGALEIYNADPQIREFFQRYGSEDYNPEAGYVLRAKEAGWLARLMTDLKPAGRELPAAFSKFLEVYQNLTGEQQNDVEGLPAALGEPDADAATPAAAPAAADAAAPAAPAAE
jgi:hypothetical protein